MPEPLILAASRTRFRFILEGAVPGASPAEVAARLSTMPVPLDIVGSLTGPARIEFPDQPGGGLKT